SFASMVLSDWQTAVGDTSAACARMPSMVSSLIGPEVATLAQRVADKESYDAGLVRDLARLVFTFEHPDTAARLYRKGMIAADVSWRDSVAMAYGHALGGNDTPAVDGEAMEALADRATAHPDALTSLA